MELSHEFTVQRPMADVWRALVDLRSVAAALPGASVEDAESDGTYLGTFRVKLGSFVASFRGKARYVTVDDDEHTFVLEGSGNSPQGDARLQIQGRAGEAGEAGQATTVHLVSSITLTGRIAQVGSALAPQVVSRLLDQFVVNMTAHLQDPSAADSPAGSQAGPPGESASRSNLDGIRSADSFDLGGTALLGRHRQLLMRTVGAAVAGIGLVVALRGFRRPATLVIVIPTGASN